MLSQELRPFDFNEMAGQEENKRILSAIIRDPEKAPKCLIFAGAFGSIIIKHINIVLRSSLDLIKLSL